jgi:hypothetical protein
LKNANKGLFFCSISPHFIANAFSYAPPPKTIAPAGWSAPQPIAIPFFQRPFLHVAVLSGCFFVRRHFDKI